jgi:hypothetical protein
MAEQNGNANILLLLLCTCRVHSVSTAGMWLATLAVCEEPALQHLSKGFFVST